MDDLRSKIAALEADAASARKQLRMALQRESAMQAKIDELERSLKGILELKLTYVFRILIDAIKTKGGISENMTLICSVDNYVLIRHYLKNENMIDFSDSTIDIIKIDGLTITYKGDVIRRVKVGLI